MRGNGHDDDGDYRQPRTRSQLIDIHARDSPELGQRKQRFRHSPRSDAVCNSALCLRPCEPYSAVDVTRERLSAPPRALPTKLSVTNGSADLLCHGVIAADGSLSGGSVDSSGGKTVLSLHH
jgi:hypothetical protein